MTKLTLETTVRQHPDQIAAEADGEVLMMHVESGHYFGLNEVASFIWNQLDHPRTIAELCTATQAEFVVDEDRCVADALAFLQGMVEDGLAEVVASAATVADTGTRR
jgi:hypothetical protein